MRIEENYVILILLGRKTMKEFFALRTKAYAYLADDDSEKKKVNGTKKVRNKMETDV